MSYKWRILVVDDDEDLRRLVAMTLRAKYEVIEASDGLDALTKMEYSDPDFIVMDINMPLMDGFETCFSIRRHSKHKGVPVLFLSGMDDKGHIKKGYEVGANLYLTKPIDPMRLLKNVDMFFMESPPPPKPQRKTLEEIDQLEKEVYEDKDESVYDAETVRDSHVGTPLETPPHGGIVADEKDRCFTYQCPRLMIVDDDPDIITIIKASLKDRVEVVWAMDSVEAIDKIAHYEPDMIFLDVMMPKFSGFQLLQVIRRNLKFKDTPVAIVSAKNTEKDKQYALRLGATAYQTKPVTPQDLVNLVDTFTKRRDFKVKPKKMIYSQIVQREAALANKDIAEDEERKFLKKEEGSTLQKFIDKYMQGEPEREEGASSEEPTQ